MRSCRAISVVKQVGPGGRRPRHLGHRVTACASTRAATAACSSTGSSGRLTTPSAFDQEASQASCGRPVSTSVGRAAVDLVLELARQAQAADLVRLAVEDQQVEPAGLGGGDDGRGGRDLDPLDVGRAAPQPTPDGEPHLRARVDVVAVQQDARAGGRGCVLGLRRARGLMEVPHSSSTCVRGHLGTARPASAVRPAIGSPGRIARGPRRAARRDAAHTAPTGVARRGQIRVIPGRRLAREGPDPDGVTFTVATLRVQRPMRGASQP